MLPNGCRSRGSTAGMLYFAEWAAAGYSHVMRFPSVMLLPFPLFAVLLIIEAIPKLVAFALHRLIRRVIQLAVSP